MNKLIKNGTILTAVDEFIGDIFIQDEKIETIGKNLQISADQVIDADEKYVMPGGVDQHVHYSFEFKGEKVRGFETSHAAVAGGTTTVVELVNEEQVKSLIEFIYDNPKKNVVPVAMADDSYHAVVCDQIDSKFEDISKLPERGISTVKLYMAYKRMLIHSDDEALYKALKKAKEAGVTGMVHCENADIIDLLQKQVVEEGKTDPYYHAVSRPERARLRSEEHTSELQSR